MSSSTTIFIGYDKSVSLGFTFSGDFSDAGGLLAFTQINVDIGGESYNSVDNTEAIVVVDESTLRISIGDVTALTAGAYHPTIIGINATYNDGYPLLVRGCGGLSYIGPLNIEEI